MTFLKVSVYTNFFPNYYILKQCSTPRDHISQNFIRRQIQVDGPAHELA
jgi:hypothetical protein